MPKSLLLRLVKNKKVSWLFTIAIFTLAIILYVNLGKFLVRDIFIKGNPFVAGAGNQESYLPAEVLAMQGLATRRKIVNFRMSELISSDASKYQRAIEFLYPIRGNAQSKFLFAMHEEKVSIGCDELEREGTAILYYCQ